MVEALVCTSDWLERMSSLFGKIQQMMTLNYIRKLKKLKKLQMPLKTVPPPRWSNVKSLLRCWSFKKISGRDTIFNN